MREHRDTINRLSIGLDEDAQRFEVYASRFENRLQARLVQKLDFDDLRCWAYDVDGVMVELYWDDATGQGNIRRAVLELAIACEVFAKHTLFGGSNNSALAFEALEDKKIISVRVLDMIDIGGVGVSNGSFKKYDEKAYQDIDYIFRARNKVAHRGDPVFRDNNGNLQKVDAKLLRQWWISVEKLFSWAG